VPSLALALALVERAELRGHPVAIADEAGLRVLEASGEAARRGVRSGMTLREAVALCPRLAVVELHPARVRVVAEQLVEAAAAVSPLVEEVEPGTVLVDLRGLEEIYPDADELERGLLRAAPDGLRPQLGVADERFTALVAAHSAEPGAALRVRSGESAVFLAGRPAAWLPLDAEARERLRLFGIRTIGDYAALPGHAAQAQFGVQGRRAWLVARGEDPEPLHPRPFEHERVRERMQPETPLISRESILLGAQQLLRRALRHPRAAGRFVRLVRLSAVSEDEQLWQRAQTLREPTNDRGRLWTAIRSQFEHAELPGAIAELELELAGLTAETGRQPGLFVDHARRRGQLDEMVRHLTVRFGHSPLAQVVEVEPWSRLPERRFALMDYDP
jgi:DNA polymerase-4/protein ImuB